MKPILAHNTLNHFVFGVIVWIRIWPLARTIDTREILPVHIAIVVVQFAGIQFTAHGQYFGCATIATEIAFRIQFDEIVIVMALVAAGQTNASSFAGVVP